jgi:membrane fusion protein, multidrug efflux system
MRHTSLLRLAYGIGFLLLLAACGKAPVADVPRVVLVTQAKASGSGAQVFAGDVRARQEVNISFRVAGKISQRYVDAGARVVAGQVLARLDDSDLNLQSQAATASVQALKADRDLAQSELRRYQELVAQKLVSQSLFDSKKAQAQAAQSRYQQALAQSQVNANQSGYAVIRAPGPGVISQRFAEAGQVVAAGQSVFGFAADGARDVAITVAEQHLPTLRIGQPVSIELWTQSGQRYAGRIREIAGSADALTRTYAVRVALEEAGAVTQLGQSARVLIDDGSNRTIRVPMSALTETGDKNPALWVLGGDGKIRKRAVQVARYGAEQAEISSGIALNEWFVQAGVHLLREAETVAAVDADNRAVRAVNAP